jgi:hypothetical protein
MPSFHVLDLESYARNFGMRDHLAVARLGFAILMDLPSARTRAVD